MQYRKYLSVSGLAVIAVSVLFFSCLAGLMLGYIPLSFPEVLGALAGCDGAAADIVRDLRLPRIILSAAAGMGLALSGVVMQAMFRNPMASPYIMGISSGASLGAVAAVFLGIGSAWGAGGVGLGAFAGALLMSVILAGVIGKKSGMSYILIAGVALGAVCSGITGVIIYSGAASSGIDVTLYWMMGSVAFAKTDHAVFLLMIVIAVSAFFLRQSRILNLMLLGREGTLPLGRDLMPFFRLYILVNALLVGCIVMEAGLIGFVGLVVPHFVRSFIGADHKKLVPLAVLCGGILTVWADILGRVLVTGADVPLGVTLGLIGAPLFIYMQVRKSYNFGKEPS